MTAGKRTWVLVLFVLVVGAVAAGCGEDDCWNNCTTWNTMCIQNCDIANPTRGPVWEECVSTCNLEAIACQNNCFWGDAVYPWW